MLRNNFTILLFLSVFFVRAQDTIFVYETIYLTDTVWLEPIRDTDEMECLQSIEDATLLFDTLENSATLVYFSAQQSATIPINRIYTQRNQLKSTSMKKASFFTLMFLAFQSIGYAQPDFSAKLGGSVFMNRALPAAFGQNMGFEMKGGIGDSNFSLGVGYEHHVYGQTDEFSFFSEALEEDIQVLTVKQTHHSIPVLLYYSFKRINGFAGYEFKYVDGSNSSTFRNETSMNNFYRNEHGLTGGFEYRLNENIGVLGKIYWGDAFVGKNSTGLKIVENGSCFDLSVKYYLNRK